MKYVLDERLLKIDISSLFNNTIQDFLDAYIPSKKYQHLLIQNKWILIDNKPCKREDEIKGNTLSINIYPETYNYQKVKNSIVDYIINNYEVGTKLPTMQEFSEIFDVSTNTIRKALTELNKAGYIEFQRGRFGGTFLTAMPKTNKKSNFKWLAVSPEYQEVYNN